MPGYSQWHLREEFLRQSEWRLAQAEVRADPRIVEAASCFDRLAASTGSIDADVFQTYVACLESLPQELYSEFIRGIGFYSWPEHAENFCRSVIALRPPSKATAAPGDCRSAMP